MSDPTHDDVATARSRVRGAQRAGAEPSRPERETKLLNVGYGNMVMRSRVVAVVSSQSSASRRLRDEAESRNMLVDATQGRRTRSILVLDTGHVVMSAVNPETVSARIEGGEAALA